MVGNMKTRFRKRQPTSNIKIAEERIEILLNLAKNAIDKPKMSKKYVEMARKIGKRYNVRLIKEQKMSFCKKCNQILIHGKTSEVRMDSKKKVITIKCTNCGNIYIQPYK
jgi:ribonuclease P protein subunit RPR2